jgi:ATP-binding cassette subfamily B protein
MIIDNRKDVLVLIAYAVVTSLLSLAVPLAAQSLVNTIAAGIFIQPLVVLTLLLLAVLLMGGGLRLIQLWQVEILQQRIFATTSLVLAQRLPRTQAILLSKEYGPELVNRFFDVFTIQKTWAKILLDGPSSLLQVLFGLVLLAFYSPVLLGFDAVLIIAILVIFGLLGKGAVRTSIQESVRKYDMAHWLEELARCHIGIRLHAEPAYGVRVADQRAISYLEARRKHFHVIFRQSAGYFFFQALASAGILGIGGWLVINRQLTLGQLVASELVILSVLSALDKLIRLAEEAYDLLTGLDKVGHILDLPLEDLGGQQQGHSGVEQGPIEVLCKGLSFQYDSYPLLLDNFNLHVPAGGRVALVGNNGAGKTTLTTILAGLQRPMLGLASIDGIDVRDWDLAALRSRVALVSSSSEIIEGTLEENILLGREWLTYQDLRRAIDLAQLTDDILKMPNGLKTQVVSEGLNLSLGQRKAVLFARAIVSRPGLLILDEAFSGMDETTKTSLLAGLFDRRQPWTILATTHDPQVMSQVDVIHVLNAGRIVESGSLPELVSRRDSVFCQLHPEWALFRH